MARYTTVTTFKRDWWPKGKDTDQRFISGAADAAASIIDVKLGKCYSVPFTIAATAGTYPPFVVTLSNLITKLLAEYMVEHGRIPTIKVLEEKALMNPFVMMQEIVDGNGELYDADGNQLGRLTATGAWVPSHQVDYRPIFEIDDDLEQFASEDLIDELDDWRDT
jgi:hypothetical protein